MPKIRSLLNKPIGYRIMLVWDNGAAVYVNTTMFVEWPDFPWIVSTMNRYKADDVKIVTVYKSREEVPEKGVFAAMGFKPSAED